MNNYLVVGGTRGIGEQIVQSLGDDNVYVMSRNAGNGTGNSRVHFINADVTAPNIDVTMLPEVIDGLVYCPGSINLKPFHRFTEADFLNDWQVNFMGAVKIIQAVLPLLKKSANASVVLFSTVAATTGMPFHTSIAAAKAAVEGLTVSLAAELAPKIRVNCIAPSLVNTPLAEKLVNTPEKLDTVAKRHPMQRVGTVADIAAMATFLLGQNAGWMTGQVLHVDGGLSNLKV